MIICNNKILKKTLIAMVSITLIILTLKLIQKYAFNYRKKKKKTKNLKKKKKFQQKKKKKKKKKKGGKYTFFYIILYYIKFFSHIKNSIYK